MYTNVRITWDDDWVPVLDTDEVEGFDLESIKVIRPPQPESDEGAAH